MTKNRIQILKEKMLSQPRYVSIEQALIITKTYKQHENEPIILKRAYALANALRELEIGIENEELIVGNRTKGVRYGVVFPESGISWVDREFETIPTRKQDKFLVRDEDIKIFREQIVPYWKGKSLEDVIKQNFWTRNRCDKQSSKNKSNRPCTRTYLSKCRKVATKRGQRSTSRCSKSL